MKSQKCNVSTNQFAKGTNGVKWPFFGSFYNEFDFEQLGTPENIDDFDQMKFGARPTYFNSKDRGN